MNMTQEMTFFNIHVSAVNVHSKPDFNSAVVTQALLGESCAILNYENNWFKIRQDDGYEGWVYHFFGNEADNRYEFTHSCFSMFAPVLEKKGGRVIRDICFGSRLHAKAEEDGYFVILPGSETGWTNAKLKQTPLQRTRENIIKTAKRFNGTPYQWGGKSPGGIDCSGFTQTVFKSVGIQLPRDAYQQAEYFKESQINIGNAKEGDILFFTENKKVSHVAISLGVKDFIHAQGWVKEQSLDKTDPDYNSGLAGLLTSVCSITELFS